MKKERYIKPEILSFVLDAQPMLAGSTQSEHFDAKRRTSFEEMESSTYSSSSTKSINADLTDESGAVWDMWDEE